MNITYIEGDLTIPVRGIINLGYTYLKFDKDALSNYIKVLQRYG